MKTIDARDLKKMQDADETFLLVNTLSSEDFASTKIPGAVNIPQSSADFAEQVEKQSGGKEKTVVVYCASASCNSSTEGAKKLEQAGFTDVYDFEDGAEGWQKHEKAAGGKGAAKQGSATNR